MSDNNNQQTLAEWREAYKLFTDKTHKNIEKDTFKHVANLLGFQPNNDEINDMFNEVCGDNNSISWEQFCNIMSRKMYDQDAEQELQNAFNVFDEDADGYLNANEIMSYMKKMGEEITDEEANEMVKDVGSERGISFDDFVKMIMTR